MGVLPPPSALELGARDVRRSRGSAAMKPRRRGGSAASARAGNPNNNNNNNNNSCAATAADGVEPSAPRLRRGDKRKAKGKGKGKAGRRESSSSGFASSSYGAGPTSKRGGARAAGWAVREGVAEAEAALMRPVSVHGDAHAASLGACPGVGAVVSVRRLPPWQRRLMLAEAGFRWTAMSGCGMPSRHVLARRGVRGDDCGDDYDDDYDYGGESEHDYRGVEEEGVRAERPIGFAVKRDRDVQALATLRPTQLRAVNYVRKHAEAASEAAVPKLVARARELGFGRPEWVVARTLEYLRDDAPIVVHFPDEVLPKLLAEGANPKLRNQFATKTSRGSLNSRCRKAWEARLFGGAYTLDEDIEDVDRPVYGCWNVANDPRGVAPASQYGNCFVVLRGVRLRATITDQDSSCSHCSTGVPEHAAHLISGFSDDQLRDVFRAACQGIPGSMNPGDSYREVQIHGGVPLVGNVASLVVDQDAADRKVGTGGKTVRQIAKALAERIGTTLSLREVRNDDYGGCDCEMCAPARRTRTRTPVEREHPRGPAGEPCACAECAPVGILTGDDDDTVFRLDKDLRAESRRRRAAKARGGRSRFRGPSFTCTCCIPQPAHLVRGKGRRRRAAAPLADELFHSAAPGRHSLYPGSRKH